MARRIKDLKKWKDIPYSRVRRLNIVKMLILFELIYQFKSHPIKIPAEFFLTDKLTLLFLLNSKELKKTKQLYNNNNELLT